MKLEGKYIVIDKNVIDDALRFLYSKGYKWINNYYENENVSKIVMRMCSVCEDNGDVLHIRFYNHSSCRFGIYSADIVDNSYDFVDINKLLREEKLKRILK